MSAPSEAHEILAVIVCCRDQLTKLAAAKMEPGDLRRRLVREVARLGWAEQRQRVLEARLQLNSQGPAGMSPSFERVLAERPGTAAGALSRAVRLDRGKG
jgi:hypothetical protein